MMGKVFHGFLKFFVANLAIVLVILLLPVFLITDDVSIMDQIMDYLFNGKG